MKSSCYFVFSHPVLLCPNLYSINLHNSLRTRSILVLVLSTAEPPGLSLVASGLVLYSRGTDNAENTILFLHSADHTENQSRDSCLASPLARWLLPSNENKHSSYCCVRLSQGVYRAVAWQCVDMSKYYIRNISDFCRRFRKKKSLCR
jgi:hypothetical protein